MTTLTELQAAPAFLMRAMQRDPTLRLAQAAAWLDPLRCIDEGDIEDAYYDGAYEEDPDALALYALSISRRCFPAGYCEMVEGLRQGWGFRQLGSGFAAALTRAYPHLELDSLYDLGYGVPLPFVGLEVSSPDFIDQHPDYVALLAEYFSLPPTILSEARYREPYPVIDYDAFEALWPVANHLVRSLIAQDRQPYADLALLLLYLFSRTGNSLLDYSVNDYYDAGFQPLDWEPDALAMADEACQQVAIVLDAAERALHTLANDKELSHALKNNIAALIAAERMNDVTLSWPARHRSRSSEPGTDRATDPHAALVFVRDCFAEAD